MYLPGNPIALFAPVFRSGNIRLSKIPLFLVYSLKAIYSSCFGVLEMLFFSRRIERSRITAPPLFILGHYRSGTTLLQKLLISNPGFGYISYLHVLDPASAFFSPGLTRIWLNKLIRLLKVKNVFFHNLAVDLDDPGEEDLYMISNSSACSTVWGFLFPTKARIYFERWTALQNEKDKKKWQRAFCYYLKRITMRNGGKPLVLKNPPDTARIKHLLEIFPEARFIHIYRNPYDLYYSMEHLWSKVILKHFALQKISEEEKIENIYTIYLMLMDQFEQDRGLIPADHLVEVRYEDLERDPLGEIIKIWDALGIPADELMVERLQQRIVREKKYKKFNHQFDEETLDEIYQRWGYYIDLWHYERPTICQTQVKIPAEHELSR